MELLTQSRLRAARSCMRRHYYQYEQCVAPLVEVEALSFGDLVHVGLAAWWNATSVRLTIAIAAMRAHALTRRIDPMLLVRAEVLLTGYDARWGEEQSRYTVIGVEKEFRAPLVNPDTNRLSRIWELGGKFDAIVLDGDRYVLVEHKTSSEDLEAGADYWRRLRMDSQLSTYVMGARANGIDIAYCLYDVLRKPRERMRERTKNPRFKKDGTPYAGQQLEDETLDEYRDRLLSTIAESPDSYFARAEIPRLEDDIAEHHRDLWAVAQQIRDAQLRRAHPRNPDACNATHSLCTYFDVCTGVARIDDATRFRRKTKHAELSEGMNGNDSTASTSAVDDHQRQEGRPAENLSVRSARVRQIDLRF